MNTRIYKKMLFFVMVILFFCSFKSFSTSVYSQQLDWNELSSDHFKVFFLGDDKFPKEILDKAEYFYQRIATDLGYPRYSEFWTWDKRVKIYIYPDHQSFLRSTNQPNWSQGMADYNRKAIFSYAWSQGFADSLLPHEMAHLIFRDFVGFRGEIPLWLDEGVAQWAEEPKRNHIKALARHLYENDQVLSLKSMMDLDIRKVTDSTRVYIKPTRTKEGQNAVMFLSGENLVNTYYLEAVSLVGFLIEKYGSDSFAEFCRQLRDGKSMEEALRFSYPSRITSLDELDKRWREYLAGGG